MPRTTLAAVLALSSLALAAAPPARPTLAQKKKYAEALSLGEQARRERSRGKFREALALYRRALEVELSLFGPDHDLPAETLEQMAATHAALGEFAESADCFAKAARAVGRVWGEGNWRQKQVREHQRDALRLKAASSEALKKGQQANKALAEFARLARAGRFEESLAPLARAKEGTKALFGEKSARYAKLLVNEGVALRNLGEHKKAGEAYRAALAVLRPALGEDHPTTLSVLNNLAALLHLRGDFADALALQEKVLQARQRAEPRVTPEWATAVDNLGVMHLRAGKLREALTLTRMALKARAKLYDKPHPDVGDSFVNLSAVYEALGDLAASLRAAEQAVDVYRKCRPLDRPRLAQALLNYGAALATVNSPTAGRVLRDALDLCRDAHGPRGAQTAAALELLGNWHGLRGDLEQARKLLEESRDVRKEAWGEKSAEFASSTLGLASVQLNLGRPAEAEKLARQSLVGFRAGLGPRHPRIGRALSLLAGFALERDKQDEARKYADEAIDLARGNLDLAAAVHSERQQLDALEDAILYLHTRLSVRDADDARSHAYLLEWKGAVFASQQRRRRLARLASAGGEAAKLAEELDGVTRRLAALVLSGKFSDEARQLTARRERLEVALASRGAKSPSGKPHSSAEVAARLPKGAVLLDWFVLRRYTPGERSGDKRWQPRLNVWVLRRGKRVVRLDLGPAGEVERLIDGWRQSIERGRPAGGGRVASRVWAPLRKYLAGAKLVLVSPDGPLTRLPWAALPGEKPGTYLIEDVPLVVVPAPALLRSGPAAPPGRLAVVGGVDFGAGKPWPALPGTRPEAAEVARRFRAAFPRRQVAELYGDRADAPSLRRALAGASHAHLATHGYFVPPAPGRFLMPVGFQGLARWSPGLQSGLVLAGANSPDTAGGHMLTALEAAELDLSRMDLAVLSACQTGLGREAGGEGLLGLQRAFQVAGCRSVVSSLWSVHDAATAALMERFYYHLWEKKLSKAEALRQAQLDVLRRPELVRAQVKKLAGVAGLRGIGKVSERIVAGDKRPHSPPAWWAAWQLSGAWE